MHTIKPIDRRSNNKCTKNQMIVTIEEHNIIGGLGSAVAEVKSTIKNYPNKFFLE